MAADTVEVQLEGETGEVALTVPTEEAIWAVYNSLDAQDDVEYLAMLALNEGILKEDTPEELLTCYHEETGHEPRLPGEGED